MNIFKKISQWFTKIFTPRMPVDNMDNISDEIPFVVSEKKGETPHIDMLFILKFWLIWLVVVGIAYLIFQSLTVIYLILSAYIISIAVESVIMFLWNRGCSRGFSIAITYLFLVAFLLSGLILIVPFLFNQLSTILHILIDSIKSFQTSLATQWLENIITNFYWLPTYAKQSLINIIGDPAFNATIQNDLQNNISQLVGIGTSYAQNIGNIAVSLVSWFVSFITQLTIVVVLAVLFSIEKKLVMRFVSWLRGKEDYNFAYAKLDRIYKKLGLWLKGQLLLCVLIGLLVFVALHVLGWFWFSLPTKWSLALIAWLTEFVPYLWPLLWGLPAVLLWLINFGLWWFVVVFFVYRGIQWIENNVLIPIIMEKTLGISPLLIFLCVILGGLVMWFVWFVLGVPIAVIISMMYKKEE